jgi:hypothetical protein
MRVLMTMAAGATLLIAPAGASTRPCRDAQGRIITCPKPATVPQHRCKNAAGQFVKCDHPTQPGPEQAK